MSLPYEPIRVFVDVFVECVSGRPSASLVGPGPTPYNPPPIFSALCVEVYPFYLWWTESPSFCRRLRSVLNRAKGAYLSSFPSVQTWLPPSVTLGRSQPVLKGGLSPPPSVS